MDIERARMLKYGAKVRCPSDRGAPAFNGVVRSEDCATSNEQLSHQKDRFIWISVSGPGGVKSVWPSNRLS